MTLYLDANVLIALLTTDELTPRAVELLQNSIAPLLVSDLSATEFASAISRRVRTREMNVGEALEAFANLDLWSARYTQRMEIIPADIQAAGTLLRRLDLTPRTADAIHIAIAQRLGATLATFDVKMAACAQALGVPVAA